MSTQHTTKIYGASDDLVYACGDEFDSYDKPTYLQFNDGTQVKVEYDSDGCWRVDVVTRGEATRKKWFGLPDDDEAQGDTQCHGDKDAPSYSDLLILTWDQPIEIVQSGHKQLKDPPKELKTAKAIVATLQDRAGFDDWWCDARDEQNEILAAIAEIIEKGAK
jgi:hypothetical protein